MAIKHKQLDLLTDILQEIFMATENNLKAVPVIGLIKDTPLAIINNQLKNVSKKNIDFNLKVIERVEDMLKVDLSGFKDEVVSNIGKMEKTLQIKNIAPLKRDLLKATQHGIDRMPKIRKNGRNYGYKEYMEMRVRTDLAHELGELQLKVGGEAGRVFYICNVFEDSADDHAPFQGRYYYDMRYKSFGYDDDTIKKIEDGIRKLKIMPLQHVRDKKPFLTTRPNCRHTFTPVSIEQALEIDGHKMARDLGITTGSYKDAKYKATQDLRYMERQIRKYEYKWRMYKQTAGATTDKTLMRELVEKQGQEYAKYMKWRKLRKAHVAKHAHLKTDERREARDTILNDLGVKYNYDNLVSDYIDL